MDLDAGAGIGLIIGKKTQRISLSRGMAAAMEHVSRRTEMKQVLVLIVVAAVLTVLLGGCGAMRDNGQNRPAETYPMTGSTLLTGEVMPDPRDGEVTDSDGIIGNADAGARTDLGDRIDEAVEDVREDLGMTNGNAGGNVGTTRGTAGTGTDRTAGR